MKQFTTLLSVLKKRAQLSIVIVLLIVHILVHTKQNMQQAAQAFVKTPAQSAWKVTWELDISDHSLRRIMKDIDLKVYRLLQALMEDDPDCCMQFVEWWLIRSEANTTFLKTILRSDQAAGKNLVLQQDAASPHFRLDVHNFLDQHFPERIGHFCQIDWPSQFPDLTPLDFAIWGILKDVLSLLLARHTRIERHNWDWSWENP